MVDEQRELREPTQYDKDRAAELVCRELDESFGIEYAELPRNVGVLGDEGVRGDTVMITSVSDDPSRAFTNRYEELGRLASQISNETTATKVLVDITPPCARPRFLREKPTEDTRPFIERVKSRIEGYYLLKKEWYDQLDDPEVQENVWLMMDEMDKKIRETVTKRDKDET